MNLERNKAIVERYYGELNRGNLSVVDELIDTDFVAHDPNLPTELREGRDNLKRAIERSRIAFPDQRMEMDDIIAEGDLVACRLKFYAHLASDWDGDTDDSREVAYTGMGMYRIANDRIAEAWLNFDHYTFLQQLGALPADTRDPDAAPRG
jgi:predicted ester cyclase